MRLHYIGRALVVCSETFNILYLFIKSFENVNTEHGNI